MSETRLQRGGLLRGTGLVWNLLAPTFVVLAAGIAYEGKREMREDRVAHERCRDQATDIVGAATCTCVLKREGDVFQHALVMLAPRVWQELWHRATRNECMVEAYGRIVTEPGVEVVRPRPLPGAEGRNSL